MSEFRSSKSEQALKSAAISDAATVADRGIMNANEYLEKFGVEQKIKEALVSVLKDRPEDPVAVISDILVGKASITPSLIKLAGSGVSAAEDAKVACAAAIAAAKVPKPTMAFCACEWTRTSNDSMRASRPTC